MKFVIPAIVVVATMACVLFFWRSPQPDSGSDSKSDVSTNPDSNPKQYDLLVSGFASDSIGRYDSSTGEFSGTFDSSSGLDGTLVARIGPDGLLYVASEESHQIQRYDAATGKFIDHFVDAESGGMKLPSGITWDQDGNLLVACFKACTVLKFDGKTGAFIEILVEAGKSGLRGPDNGTIVGPDGKLYVPSYYTNQILRYDLQTKTSEVFIEKVGRPRVLVFKGDHLFITSETDDAVCRYDLDGKFVDHFIQPGSDQLDEPAGLAFLNEHWFVSSVSQDNVLQFDAAGKLINADFISAGSGGLDAPVFITPVLRETTN